MSRWLGGLGLVIVAFAAGFGVSRLVGGGDGARPSGEASVAEEEAATARFVEIWGQRQGLFRQNRFLGIQTVQNPLDAWATWEIIAEVRPDFVVETGTYRGGSAALWATVLEQVNPEGRVLTVDLEDYAQQARRLPIVQRRVDFLLGSSVAPEIVSEIEQRVAGKRVLVILDSAHTHEHVLAELRAYGPLVPRGSYVIVQDTGLWKARASVLSGAARAVDDFLAENDAFRVDESRERFVLTSNPRGYLRRVR